MCEGKLGSAGQRQPADRRQAVTTLPCKLLLPARQRHPLTPTWSFSPGQPTLPSKRTQHRLPALPSFSGENRELAAAPDQHNRPYTDPAQQDEQARAPHPTEVGLETEQRMGNATDTGIRALRPSYETLQNQTTSCLRIRPEKTRTGRVLCP